VVSLPEHSLSQKPDINNRYTKETQHVTLNRQCQHVVLHSVKTTKSKSEVWQTMRFLTTQKIIYFRSVQWLSQI